MFEHVPDFSAIARRAVPQVPSDLRRFRRVQIDLKGRYMRADRSEHECHVRDISVGGAAVSSDGLSDAGERIVVYFNHLGGFDGKVTRRFKDGFGIEFLISPHKREKLAAQITWLLNRDDFPDEANRRHERTGGSGRKSMLRIAGGPPIEVEILDLSSSGASLATAIRSPIGTDVVIGKVRARVRRTHASGIGVEFDQAQDTEQLLRGLI